MSKRFKPVDGFDTVDGLVLGEDGLCFVDDPTTCIKRRKADGDVVTTVAGTDALEVGSADVETKVPLILPAGTAAACALQDTSNADRGIYFDTDSVYLQGDQSTVRLDLDSHNNNREINVTARKVNFTDSQLSSNMTIDVFSYIAHPTIEQANALFTLQLLSSGSAQIVIDSGNAASDKSFLVKNDGEGILGTRLFEIAEDGTLDAPLQAYFNNRSTSTQTLTSGSPAKLTLWDATADTIRNMSWDGVDDVTIDHDGVYCITVNLGWAAATAGNERTVYLTKNDDTTNRLAVDCREGFTTSVQCQNLAWVGELVDGDTVQVYAFQNQGSDLDIGGTSFRQSVWNIAKIS